MAEIPIERKEHRNIWPWIIGIIVLLIILWLLFGRHRNDNTAATGTDTAAMMAPAGAGPATPAGGATGTGTNGTMNAAPGTAAPATGAPATGAPGTSGTTGSGTPGTTTP